MCPHFKEALLQRFLLGDSMADRKIESGTAISQLALVYSPGYDIKFFGIEKLHPFDSCKYSRVWNTLYQTFPKELDQIRITPQKPIDQAELLTVHDAEYLARLRSSPYVAQALELPFLASAPILFLDRLILQPMRLAARGTVLAAHAALQKGLAINLSGGYHHASREKGEGFCIYGDVYLAIADLRKRGDLIKGRDRVLYIDLDAHQGNGVERLCRDDPDVYIIDMYNAGIYPNDYEARRRIDFDLPLSRGTDDTEYLNLLAMNLISAIAQADSPKIAFYNAGTDVYSGDRLGGLNLSRDGILKRDLFVLQTLRAANIPCAMVLSGGYSQESYQLVANTITHLLLPA